MIPLSLFLFVSVVLQEPSSDVIQDYAYRMKYLEEMCKASLLTYHILLLFLETIIIYHL